MRLLMDDLFSSSNGAGYVLDFSNSTFSEFFRNDVGIDIDDEKYCQQGGSKGKRLRALLQIEDGKTAAKVLRALWDYREGLFGPALNQHDKFKEERFLKIVHEMEEDGATVPIKRRSTSPSTGPSAEAIAELNARYHKLLKMKAQERGFAFERLLSDLFGVYGLNPRQSFRTVGEQIDGSFSLMSETLLFEAKWQDGQTGQADLLTFSGKVEGKAQWSRGLFISYSGFSVDGLEAFSKGRRTSIICMDGLDLIQILANKMDLIDVIQKKMRHAAETGRAFVSVRDLFPGII